MSSYFFMMNGKTNYSTQITYIIKCFSSLSSLSSRSLLINRYCSILLRTHWTWESDLQWNNHQLLMILALEDEKLQTTHQMERDEEDLVVLCCCWCGLRLNMLFALAKYSSFLCFFAIMILKTFIHYCWFV